MSGRREMEDYEHEGMIDSMMCRRGEPTNYAPPERDQKWRARNVISFHFRHFAYKAPSGFRDVLLCAIDHANPTTGRCDVGQRRIARECNLGRQYVNQAMRWWEENTYFLCIENRPGRTNAYHIQWANLEADWHQIQARIHEDASVTRRDRVTNTFPQGGVATYPTPGVATDTTGGVTSDTTLNIKRNLKAETQHEMARSPAANDAYDDFLENRFDGVTQPLSESVESPKGFQEEKGFPAGPLEQLSTNVVPSLQTQLPDDPRIQALARWESASKKKPWSNPAIRGTLLNFL